MPQQWKSGAAAWLGWLFDGLDMRIYTLVWTVFVAQLMGLAEDHADVGTKGSIIQAAFLVGWAVGGWIFGRVGDLLGRGRALTLTILPYALFTMCLPPLLEHLTTAAWKVAGFVYSDQTFKP